VPAETHVERGPLDRNAIFEIVRDRLADILEIDPATIAEGQSFVDDLDADSLALIELVEALEEELGERSVGFRIEDEDLADLKSVRERLADILGIDPATITEGQSFADDLDADSLALIELVEALEEELGERSVGFRIEDEDLADLKSVRDAVDYVNDRVKGS
jgi:acyl carrier protein